ncbi:MAG: nitrate ABC transporter ATP-binding protein [Thiobacillus sp. 63-78]|uniref:ABC transporter ATP-binding protein n=1 Tax=Thiobacillus sp. 63-78 TaxID=1895859 RepID=UPI0008691D00|nr:nitrate/sulfonate/bicarbonate ABC transporter ATP-binding protein [Thiobacillus sp. 63-78]MBN8763161.1 nitrate/sulfonate/bicarbonate ABC transporter ATP-binding protein [Thiobacillus sp.]ODV13541.1 MAG: nitrate ABC transporter ATP-binding protein [Thiobacillus sp. SCN 64-317]MBN8765929.1 nitrate/sulfonate/bicarbonate ABC transporter ATP-binding protein [Thiobacillus sp.]MBN8773679.1 nitrate/sulfonate/bicarbonate ABC transporter ATP-binding protein [Thiobacillus sp.]OJZ12755.1 MAG: nitrate A
MSLAPATPHAPLLELVGVSKSYGTFHALRDVALTLEAGELVCLVGPSGCGKSTLLRIIAGLTPVTAGTVHYRGAPFTGVNPHTAIVFQTFALFPWLTVIENVDVALKARGLDPATRQAHATQLVRLVGLAGFEAAYPRELSGGMRQKVGFARALAVEPELLCLDEPFSALDVLSAEALRGELLELWLNRSMPTQAILMVTHNIEEAVELADRIVIMGNDPGRIVSELRIDLRHPRNRKDTAFQALVDRVYATLTGRALSEADRMGTAAGAAGTIRRLPVIRLEAMGGLTETVLADNGRSDLPRLAKALGHEPRALLPLVEASEWLGFARAEQGDLVLLELGKTYAGAGIQVRKELIAGRILRLPLIRWIYEKLQNDDNQRIDRSFFVEALRSEFGGETDDQIDTVIDWGRYAELFGYDKDSDELYLES